MTTYQTGWVVVGSAIINPSVVTYTFSALLNVDSGRTAYVRLYNFTDAVEVNSTSLSSATTTPTEVSASITAGTTTGFPAARKTYLLQLKADAGASSTSAVSCTWAIVQ
jgi:hypothetical protein